MILLLIGFVIMMVASLSQMDLFAGREEMEWYTGEEEFLGVGVVDGAIRGFGVGVEAQGTDEVARLDAVIALAGMGCEGEECDDEEVGEVHCDWGCDGVLRVKLLSYLVIYRSESLCVGMTESGRWKVFT